MVLWSLPKGTIFLSAGGIVYCSSVLYYFTYSFCVAMGTLIIIFSVYAFGCIAHMIYSTRGRRLEDSRLSTSSKGISTGGSPAKATPGKPATAGGGAVSPKKSRK